MIEVEIDNEGNVNIRGEATVHHAEELHHRLVEALETPSVGRRMLDLGRLVELDTAGAQLLMAFKQACTDLAVHSCPDAVRARLGQLGLSSLLV